MVNKLVNGRVASVLIAVVLALSLVLIPSEVYAAALGVTTNNQGTILIDRNGRVSGYLSGSLTGLGTSTAALVYFEYGSTASYGDNTTAKVLKKVGTFLGALPSLAAGTYHYRAVAAAGTSIVNGADKTYAVTAPTVTTGSATGIAYNSAGVYATLAGNVTGLGSYSSVYNYFEYGLTTAYGRNTYSSRVYKATTGAYTGSVSGLLPGFVYHYRAVVKVGALYYYGADAKFNFDAEPSTSVGQYGFISSNPVNVRDIVEAGCARAIESGDANFGGNNVTYSLININNAYRIRQNGYVDHFQINMDTITDLTAFHLQVWRKVDATHYDCIFTENFISKLAVGLNNLYPTKPVMAKEGDYTALVFTSTGPCQWGSGVGLLDAGSSGLVLTGAPLTNPIAYAWPHATTSCVPIKVYMSAPSVVFIGDSLISGALGHFGWDIESVVDDYRNSLPYLVGNHFNTTYQNRGEGGDDTTEILARFDAQVTNGTKVVIINGGLNDINGGVISKATFLSNWEDMLDLCVTKNVIPVVLKIFPSSELTDEEMAIRDEWNADLVTLVQTYSKYIIVDTDIYIGEFRAGGTAGNLWDIQAAYDGGDGYHLSAAGYARVAEAIYDAIGNKIVFIN